MKGIIIMYVTRMSKLVARMGLILAVGSFSVFTASGAWAPLAPPTQGFDRRVSGLAIASTSKNTLLAESSLQARISGLRVDHDPLTGVPAWVSRLGFLSKTTVEEIQRTGDLGLAKDDPHRPIKAFLAENTVMYGFGAEVLSNSPITREVISESNGLHTVVWQQQLDGVPVFEGILIGNMNKDGRLMNVSSHFLPSLENAAGMDSQSRLRIELAPAIPATEALSAAFANLGLTNLIEPVSKVVSVSSTPEKTTKTTSDQLLGEARISLTWLPMSASSIRLSWNLTFINRAGNESFQFLVDATTREIIIRRNLTCNYISASYRVYSSDSPSPFSPGWSTPSPAQPAVLGRTLVTLPATSQNASPNGWIRDTDNLTLGNNVDSSVNRLAQIPNQTARPTGSPSRVFDDFIDLSQDPSAYGSASAVNLFYWCNWMHDKLYDLGFTEAAGNFQDDNFGRGGIPGDRVLAYSQFGYDSSPKLYANNAYFLPTPDGSSGVIEMFLWDYPSPTRDGGLDSEVISHEYTHGLSTRVVGGGVGISASQTAGMGEGWSDFYSLSLHSAPTDNVNGSYPFGAYVSYQLAGLAENYYYGIRRYPYCTLMSKNPLTFKDIDPAQASLHTGIPTSPIIGGGADEVHNQGEVWCATLWDARKNVIGANGPAGNQIMLQIVTDGMKLCPPNPTFIQARDAIMQAVMVNNCGVNWDPVWSAFVRRGMGQGATAPVSTRTDGVVESYNYGPGSPCNE